MLLRFSYASEAQGRVCLFNVPGEGTCCILSALLSLASPLVFAPVALPAAQPGTVCVVLVRICVIAVALDGATQRTVHAACGTALAAESAARPGDAFAVRRCPHCGGAAGPASIVSSATVMATVSDLHRHLAVEMADSAAASLLQACPAGTRRVGPPLALVTVGSLCCSHDPSLTPDASADASCPVAAGPG